MQANFFAQKLGDPDAQFCKQGWRLLELQSDRPLSMADMMQGVKDITTILQGSPVAMICWRISVSWA